jgi:hypothetical protein
MCITVRKDKNVTTITAAIFILQYILFCRSTTVAELIPPSPQRRFMKQ